MSTPARDPVTPSAEADADAFVSLEFRYQRRVQFGETDLAGIVHFSWYFRYMEEAEHALWRAAGMSISPEQPTVGWPRVAAAFDYKSPLRFEEEFAVGVRIGAVSRRTIRYAFTMRREAAVIGHGQITVACVTKSPEGRMSAVDLPPGLVDRLRSVMQHSAADRTTGP
jgi:YbgC/YbaW family acyl-CoA thioester hydrolase